MLVVMLKSVASYALKTYTSIIVSVRGRKQNTPLINIAMLTNPGRWSNAKKKKKGVGTANV